MGQGMTKQTWTPPRCFRTLSLQCYTNVDNIQNEQLCAAYTGIWKTGQTYCAYDSSPLCWVAPFTSRHNWVIRRSGRRSGLLHETTHTPISRPLQDVSHNSSSILPQVVVVNAKFFFMDFFGYLCSLMGRDTPDCSVLETTALSSEHIKDCDIEAVGHPNDLAEHNDSTRQTRSDSGITQRTPLASSSSTSLHSDISDLSISSYYSTTSFMDAPEGVSSSKGADSACDGIDIRDFAFPTSSPLHAPTIQPDSGPFRWVKMYKKGASWKRWMTERMISEFKAMGYGVVYVGADADEEERAERRKVMMAGFREAMSNM